MSSKYFESKKGIKVVEQPKPPRAIEEVQAEYMQSCSKLGNLEYQKRTIQAEIDTTVQVMSQLNMEAAQINATKEGVTDGSTKDSSAE